MVHKALRDCRIVTAGLHKDWNNQKVRGWVREGSGDCQTRLTDDTTHLVVEAKLWRSQHPTVKDALNRKEAGQNIRIVSYDWLEDSLQSKSKKREKDYAFFVPGEKTMQRHEERSTVGLLKELYVESTEFTPAQQKMLEKHRQQAEDPAKLKQEARLREFQDFHKAKMSVSEQAAVFQQGARKAKNQLLSDNHHIYQDNSGFHYDITLTKVDTKHNTNERYNFTLQLYESNSEPHTYAFNCAFSGTKLVSTSNSIIGIGSNFPTAFRAFKKAFLEKTGVAWAERIRHAKKGAAEEKLAKNEGIGARRTLEEMRRVVFEYCPPTYGPKGDDIKELLVDDDVVEILMSSSSGQGAGITTEQRFLQPPFRPEISPAELEKFQAATRAENPEEKLEPFDPPFGFQQDPGFMEGSHLDGEFLEPEPSPDTELGDRIQGDVTLSLNFSGHGSDQSPYSALTPMGEQAEYLPSLSQTKVPFPRSERIKRRDSGPGSAAGAKRRKCEAAAPAPTPPPNSQSAISSMLQVDTPDFYEERINVL